MCLLGSFDSPDCRGLVSILRLAVIYFTLSINHDMTSQPTNFETLPARANPPPRARGSKPLGIAFSNIRGFRSNFTSVQSFVHNNSPDLLALSESRLSSDISSDSFKLPGYISFTALTTHRPMVLVCTLKIHCLLPVKAPWNVTIKSTCAFASHSCTLPHTYIFYIAHPHHHPAQ